MTSYCVDQSDYTSHTHPALDQRQSAATPIQHLTLNFNHEELENLRTRIELAGPSLIGLSLIGAWNVPPSWIQLPRLATLSLSISSHPFNSKLFLTDIEPNSSQLSHISVPNGLPGISDMEQLIKAPRRLESLTWGIDSTDSPSMIALVRALHQHTPSLRRLDLWNGDAPHEQDMHGIDLTSFESLKIMKMEECHLSAIQSFPPTLEKVVLWHYLGRTSKHLRRLLEVPTLRQLHIIESDDADEYQDQPIDHDEIPLDHDEISRLCARKCIDFTFQKARDYGLACVKL